MPRARSPHPPRAAAAAAAAAAWQDEAKLEEAEPLLREAMNGRRETLGALHRDTLDNFHMMAMLLKDQGKLSMDTR